MFSPSKHEDTKFLLEIIELIELLIKIKTTQSLNIAESFGDHYVQLQNKITTYDYREDDRRFYELETY